MSELSGEVELFVWKVAMDTVTPEDGTKLIRKAISLENQIQSMKNCNNCHFEKTRYSLAEPCLSCKKFSNWQMKEKDE